MDGQAEDADQEGGKDGAAADAVDAARQTDAQAEGRQARAADGVPCLTEREDQAGTVPALHMDPGHAAPLAGGRGGPAQVAEHAPEDPEQQQTGKDLEAALVRQPVDADQRAQHDAGQGAHGHGQGQGPEQAPFAGIAHDAAGTGQHVEKMVGGADAGAGVAQKAHLERQEQEGSRQAAHGRDERDAHGRQDGHQGVTLDTGNGKEHGPPPQVVRRGKSRVN